MGLKARYEGGVGGKSYLGILKRSCKFVCTDSGLGTDGLPCQSITLRHVRGPNLDRTLILWSTYGVSRVTLQKLTIVLLFLSQMSIQLRIPGRGESFLHFQKRLYTDHHMLAEKMTRWTVRTDMETAKTCSPFTPKQYSEHPPNLSSKVLEIMLIRSPEYARYHLHICFYFPSRGWAEKSLGFRDIVPHL
jgi:hypothetical protein